MAKIIPTNQNRHMYVLTDGSADGISRCKNHNTLTNDDPAGTIGKVKAVGEGNCKEIFFTYKGADNVLRSDLIQVKNLDYVKLVKAWDMVVPMKIVVVQLDSSVNGGLPKAGEDYVLRINLRQFHGGSDADVYIKDAVVHVNSAMTSGTEAQQKEAFYKAMEDALNRSFSREVGATATSNPYLKFGGSANALTIWELPQSWALGTYSMQRVYFDVQPTTIFDGLEDVIWGKAEDRTYELYRLKDESDPSQGTEPNIYVAPDSSVSPAVEEKQGIRVGYTSTSTGVGNGRTIADLEWFCAGERGDQYRMMGWPDYIPTTYLVNPNLQYNVLEIHHAFTDTGVNSYRGEKDITIVAPDNSAGKTALNAFITSLNSAAGTSVPTLT